MRLSLSAPSIWFYTAAIDFRKSIDGLVGLVHAELGLTTSTGVFVFYNRRRDKLKVLAWHGNGYVLLYKRLERGKFAVVPDTDAPSMTLDDKRLSWLLAGLDWYQMSHWDALSYDDYC